MISLANIKAIPEEERDNTTVKDAIVAIGDQIRIAPEASLAEALQKMRQEEPGRLIVMQNGKMAGLVTHAGVLQFLEVRRALPGAA